MSIARISKVPCPLTRTLLYEQESEIQLLKQEIERLKRPVHYKGIHTKAGEQTSGLAFPNVNVEIYD